MFKGKALLTATLAGSLVLGLQVPAHAKTAESKQTLATETVVKATEGKYVTPLSALAAAATVTVTVVRGDTLSGLAAKHCGAWSGWNGIYNDNRAVVGGNPNLIFPGQKLVINCASGTAATAPAPAPAPAAAPASSGWVAPVSACIVSNFGPRWGTMHEGVDLAAGYGVPIKAAAGGTVSTGWQANGAGNYTMINHGNGLNTVYMHESSFNVRSGWVNAGDVIGYVGATGDAQGAHLHFEVHTAGLWAGKVDPVGFMSARGVRLGC